MEVVVSFCLALARPHLRYCIQLWAPECRRDAGKLEGAGQRAPGLVGAGGLALRERVVELGFFRRGGFVGTWQQPPSTSGQVFEKTEPGTSQGHVAGGRGTSYNLK